MKTEVLILTSTIKNRGGWILDQQFLIQCGSSFLLAHGMGKPVEDATETVEFKESGVYNVWVRTRNWSKRWSKNGCAGLFNVLVDNKALDTEFGNEEMEWNWQNGGQIKIEAGKHKIALHDLTGFDGRCDAILFTTDDNRPDGSAAALAAMRHDILGISDKAKDAGIFDFVIVGGGIAGMCAAIAAARMGTRVALIQDRMVLGGNNSSEIRVALGGRCNIGMYPSLGYLMNEIGPVEKGNARPKEVYEDDRKLKSILAEENIELFLGYTVTSVEKSAENLINAVVATNVENYSKIRIEGRLFSDCSGDAWLGYMAGADWTIGREAKSDYNEPNALDVADKMTMGGSIMWYCVDDGKPSTFPDIKWGLDVDEDNVQVVHRGQWYWETGMHQDQIWDAERVRDYGIYVAISNWAYLKNSAKYKKMYENCSLGWMSHVFGKRETRRLFGEFVLREQDIKNFVVYNDGTVATSWNIDQHFPDPENEKRFPKEAYLSRATLDRVEYYPVPYRCFYSRNISNLFMAGRNISVTHMALGTVRVMRTTGMIGEVVGMAAGICTRHNALPHDVYEHYLDELKALMHKGAGKTDIPYTQIYTLIENDPSWREDN